MKPNIQSVLNKVGEILSDPASRCTGTLATDSKGFAVNPNSEHARCWCLTGALHKALSDCEVTSRADQLEAYNEMKAVIGLDKDQAAPIFWDNNEGFHDLIAKRLRNC